MKPIAYLHNGTVLLCADPQCCADYNWNESPVYGTCVDRSCHGCGEAIPANRTPGRAGYKQLTKEQKDDSSNK